MPRPLPIRIGDYIYYRRFDNPAESINLFRFPIAELKSRGLSEGQIPTLQVKKDSLHEEHESIDDFPEEAVFSIGDLKQFYADFAQRDPRIKEFVESITDFVLTQEHQPLHSFQISEE